MSRLIPFVLVAAAVGACSKADEGLKALEGVRAAACGCAPIDVACAKDGVGKLATWREQYGDVAGARSQSAKATALVEAIGACQTRHALAAIPARAKCGERDGDATPAARWCKVAGWGDAKAVAAEDLPFGAMLDGEQQTSTIGAEPGAPEPVSLSVAGTAEAPTANGMSIAADGAGWTWQDGDAAIELRKLDGGWMTLSTAGDTRRVAVFDAP